MVKKQTHLKKRKIRNLIRDNKKTQYKNKNKKNQTFKKRIFYKNKKGGAINVPIYSSTVETDICPPLTNLNEKFKKRSLKQPLIIEELEDLKASTPLYNFITVIKDMCSINKDKLGLLKEDDHIILVDNNDNYVSSNYQLLDEKEAHLFKITPQFQIEYKGTVEKRKYPLYDFKTLYKENFQYTKEHYWLNTLQFLNKLNLAGQFFNIVDITYKDTNDTDVNIKLEKYEIFVDKFIKRRPGQQPILNNMNHIIKNISFINRMEEFIKLINFDYEYYYTPRFEELISNELKFENVEDEREYQTKYDNFLTTIDKKKNKKSIETILKSVFKEDQETEYLAFKNKKMLNEFRVFKLNLITIKSPEFPESPESPLILDLKFLLFLYQKLFGDKHDLEKKSPFKDFLYTCILINHSGFYNYYNIEKKSGNANSSHPLLEGLEEIKNAYIYINLTSIIYPIINQIKDKDGEKKKHLIKNYMMGISSPADTQLLNFFDEMNTFIVDLHSVRLEFLKYEIGFCNEIIKTLILSFYVKYLNNVDDVTRPISVKSHFDKYLKGAIKNESLICIDCEKSSMEFIKESRLKVGDISFPDCGERTLLNFFKYLLFDQEKNKITPEMLETLKLNYPENLLQNQDDQLFSTDLINLASNRDQTNYLFDKKDIFATKIYSYSKSKSDSDIFHSGEGTCELKPSLENSIKMIFYLLNGSTNNNNNNNNDDLLSLIEKFGKKGIISNNNLIIDNLIKFSFHELHGDIENIKYDNGLLSIYYNNTNSIISNYQKNSLFHSYLRILESEESEESEESGYSKLSMIDNLTIYFNLNKYYELNNSNFSKIKSIIFDQLFNIMIDPKDFGLMINVEQIQFMDYHDFDQPILEDAFPALKKIIFGEFFNSMIHPKAMVGVEEIIFYENSQFNKPILEDTFPVLKKITFGKNFDSIIDKNAMVGVEEIIFHQDSQFNKPILEDAFPALKKIIFGDFFNSMIHPKAMVDVKEIKFGKYFNKEIPAGAFLALKKITFGKNFDSIIDKNAMVGVEEIIFHQDSKFDQQILEGAFPALKKITFGKNFDSIIDKNAMVGVEEIIFHRDSKFDEPIFEGAFPALKKIEFGEKFKSKIYSKHILSLISDK